MRIGFGPKGAALAFGMAAAIGLASSPAAAKVYTLTWEGTVTYGRLYENVDEYENHTGLVLDGLAWKTVYTIDDSKGATLPGLLYGGDSNGLSSPVSAVVTIGNLSWDVTGAYDDKHSFIYSPQGYNGVDGVYSVFDQAVDRTSAYGGTIGTFAAVSNNVSGLNSPPFHLDGPDQPFDLDIAGQTGLGQLNLADFVQDTHAIGEIRYTSYSGVEALANLTRVTLVPSAAPEPAVWLMMTAGFGAIGAVMRRRQPAGRRAA